MDRLLARRSVRDALIIAALAFACWLIALQFDLFDVLVDFVEEHESWELDELLTAIVLAGLAGFVYALRRRRDLRQEIQNREDTQRELDWLARHDALTGLPNRRFLESQLVGHFEADPSYPLGLYMIDLDGFKRINDLLGHEAGDQLLAIVAERLRRLLPEAIVARQGGDEFIVLVSGTGVSGEAPHARAIIQAIAEPVRLDGTTCEVGASVGYASSPALTPNMLGLMRAADLAMYAAKRAGRNRFQAYSAEIETEMRQRAGDESDLRQSLREGGIQALFQPLMSLTTGRVEGFQVLPRWHRPGGSESPPDQLVRIAEEIGVIVELSDLLLRQACSAARTWPSDLVLSFNLSSAQLSDPLLGLRILKVLDETGLTPNRLILEVAEGDLMRDVDSALGSLTVLRQAGIHIAIDDFGSSYPGATTRSDMLFDTVKLDRRLVASSAIDDKQGAVLRAVAAAGRSLGFRMIAKGVGDAGQLEVLRALGCSQAEGRFFGPPLSSEDATRLAAGEPLARAAAG